MIVLHPHSRNRKMDTQKHHRDTEAIKTETTEKLKQWIEMQKETPWLLSPEVTKQCEKWAKEREQEGKDHD